MNRRGAHLALCLGAAVTLGALTGCASVARPDAPADALSGRLSVRIDSDPVRSVSAAFELSGDAARGQLALTSPLGTLLALARWSDAGATLTTPDGRFEHASLDDLAEQALGERIPLAAMFDWLRGRPWPLAPHDRRSDGGSGFEQLGWVVDLARLADGSVEARRARLPTVTVRVRLDAPGA